VDGKRTPQAPALLRIFLPGKPRRSPANSAERRDGAPDLHKGDHYCEGRDAYVIVDIKDHGTAGLVERDSL
jgi:hypothetical protein